MKVVFYTPELIPLTIFTDLFSAHHERSPVSRIGLEDRLKNAKVFALLTDGEKTIVSTATLKHPATAYSDNVFKKANALQHGTKYNLELGYIVTASGFEGKGLCRKLLTGFLGAN